MGKGRFLIGKIKDAYNKATGRKTISMEMDGKTFTGTEKVGKRRTVTKVENPTAGSRKIVGTYAADGDLKRQKIVDKFPNGKKKVTKIVEGKGIVYMKGQSNVPDVRKLLKGKK
jgi:hypothetical protein